ncbi:hypothetical protein [Spirosoma lituiforme]
MEPVTGLRVIRSGHLSAGTGYPSVNFGQPAIGRQWVWKLL